MQQKSGEVSILAYFETENDAKQAKKELEGVNVKDLQIDRVSRFGVNMDSSFDNPIAGEALTQTGLTLFSADNSDNPDRRALRNSDPSVYSMSGGDTIEDYKPFLLTTILSDEDVVKAIDIIEANEGYV